MLPGGGGLLRPTWAFSLLQLVTSLCLVWILAVFFASLVQKSSHQSSSIAGFTVLIALLSCGLNLALIDRVFSKIYMQGLREAFSCKYSRKSSRLYDPSVHRESPKEEMDEPAQLEQPADSRIVYVEHLSHELDHDLISGLDEKGGPLALKRFAMLFIGITLCSVVTCYLNYQFPKNLTLIALIMLLCGYFGDLLLLRPLIILLLASLSFRRLKRRTSHTQETVQEEPPNK